MSKKFSKEALKEVLYDESSELQTVKDTITGVTRWSIQHEFIFKETATDKYYKVNYSRGATENQDGRPFDDDGDFITCEQVEPFQKTVTAYKPYSPTTTSKVQVEAEMVYTVKFVLDVVHEKDEDPCNSLKEMEAYSAAIQLSRQTIGKLRILNKKIDD